MSSLIARKNRIVLIGNYLPDRQESMIRFAEMLKSGLKSSGLNVEVWWPTVFFGLGSKNTNSGLGKWLGYLDKYIIFPLVIYGRLVRPGFRKPQVRFHICDHSNAPYLKYLPSKQTGITCHDVIAIRGGLGFPDSYQPATAAGKILQKWIMHNLVRANLIAAVSHLTLKQLNDLAAETGMVTKEWQVIHNAFNADFKQITKPEVQRLLLKRNLDPTVPFLLHVGSALPRKNRKILLEMVAALGNEWSGLVYFAGEAVDSDLMDLAEKLGLKKRMISVLKPDHNTLVALYNACEAFIFPSLSEGFGWPVIEAQACGAPVIASSIEPMPEISGGAAIHVHATRPIEFAEAFLSLKNGDIRNQLIQKGFDNIARFKPATMINAYLKLHGLEPGGQKL